MSIEEAQQAWGNLHRPTYALFSHPSVSDLYIVIWAWDLPVLPDPYNVTSFTLDDFRSLTTVGSSEYTLDLRGALAEVLNRIGEIKI